MTLQRRLEALERAEVIRGIPQGGIYPKWCALGILLEHGAAVMRAAGILYEGGRQDAMNILWSALVELTPWREMRARDGRELAWAWDALGEILPDWRQTDWWAPAEAEAAALVAAIERGCDREYK